MCILSFSSFGPAFRVEQINQSGADADVARALPNVFSIETLVRAKRYCYLESNLGDAE